MLFIFTILYPGSACADGYADGGYSDGRRIKNDWHHDAWRNGADTLCIVWYDFEIMQWQGWTPFDNTAQRDTFFHVDDFAGLGGGEYGGPVPTSGSFRNIFEL